METLWVYSLNKGHVTYGSVSSICRLYASSLVLIHLLTASLYILTAFMQFSPYMYLTTTHLISFFQAFVF